MTTVNTVTYKIRNNNVRDLGFAGKICRAGAGCVTPEVLAKTGRSFEPLFTLTTKEMFKSYRGVVPAMDNRLPNGNMEIDVLADGVEPKLTSEALRAAMDEYRATLGSKKPTNRDELVAELEIAMERPEDPMERHHRIREERQTSTMLKMVVEVMGANVKQQIDDAVKRQLDELTREDAPVAPKGDAPKQAAQAPTPARR